VWKEMKAQSRENDEGDHVYEGHLTKLIMQDCGLAQPLYTSVRGQLMNMGCIEQIRRGGGGSMSKWKVLKEPTEDDFREAKALRKPLTGKLSIVEQQLRDLNRRVIRAEARLEVLENGREDEEGAQGE
jgi:hypothetical protein